MRKAITFCLCFWWLWGYAQVPEETFNVKKKAVVKRTAVERLFDLNLDPGHDTICNGLFINLEPIAPYYDSIGVYNLKRKANTTQITFWATTTIGSGGQAKLKFYQRQKDNSYKLVYVRSWAIYCK